MARNEEKAQSMLSRFLQAKNEEKKKPKERRPFLASECRDLADADKWRQQIIREIGRKVMDIQNPGLGEHRLRDLNDEINKLIREKGHWEVRILELGGPDYAKVGPKVTDSEGKEVSHKSHNIRAFPPLFLCFFFPDYLFTGRFWKLENLFLSRQDFTVEK